MSCFISSEAKLLRYQREGRCRHRQSLLHLTCCSVCTCSPFKESLSLLSQAFVLSVDNATALPVKREREDSKLLHFLPFVMTLIYLRGKADEVLFIGLAF